MKIGQLAKQTECPIETIRYWEKEGLIPSPYRSEGNYRIYNEQHRNRILFIRNCRSLDMSLNEIRTLLELKDHPSESCQDINELVDSHIEHVVKRIQALTSLEQDLRNLRQRCNSESDIEHCGILEGLSSDKPHTDTESDTHINGLHGH
ncbi:Cd(II)/Pb(II)-responsive transcriptional regulator [Neptuniibacter sp. QD72_48]|uniref:Cd(II)/Pb(II)-responsive transcriptional regulator n=1 Tax=Neptuniibacter sp. QD72_48 TaxID=3398214 RepID=UPI0039F61320